MAAAFGKLQLGVEKTGVSVTVPNNHTACLMYYLDCICNALELNDSDAANIRRLRDYRNYARLSQDETDQLVLLCAMISPDILLNKCIFQSDAMCGDSQNEFYKISAVRDRFVVARSIIIGGQTRSVNKIMCFKMSWLQENYIEPMEYFSRQLENRRAAREAAKQRKKDDSCIIL